MRKKVGKMSVLAGLVLFGLFTVMSFSTASAKIKITLWSGYPEIMPTYEAAAADYEKLHPDVDIVPISFALRDQERKLAVALPTGTGPDIVESFLPTVFKYTKFLHKLPADMREFRDESVYPAMTRKDAEWGMSWFANINTLYWNKRLFAEAGLPGPPKTYKEQLAYARKLTKQDATGDVIRSGYSLRLSGAGWGVTEKWAIIGLLPYGGRPVVKTPEGKYHNAYNNEAGRNALKLYLDYVWKHKVDGYKVKHDAEAFGVEATAMFMRESWVVGYMKEHAPNVAYDTALLPVVEKYNLRSGAAQTFSLYVSTSSKQREIAWDFIKFAERPKYLKIMYLTSGWVPTRKDVDYEEIFKELPQLRRITWEGYNNTWRYYPLTVTIEMYTKLAERLVEAYRDKTLVDNPEGIAKVIADAAKETDEILKEAGYYGTE